jgi:lipopolysaccharide heptosyltransferase II
MSTWNEAQNILCVRLDSMGDVIMTTPAFRALKESKPGCKLTLLTSRSGAAIAPLIPEIDQVISFAAPWMKASATRLYPAVDLDLIYKLRGENFDAAIIFTTFSQNPLAAAYFCHLAEIPLRLGFCRENPYQLLNYWLKDNETELSARHEVERQLELVEFINCKTTDDRLSLNVPEHATRTVTSLLENTAGFNINKPWIVIHPGATAESRRYPASHYAGVAEALARELNLQILFTGVDSERQLVESIRADVRAPTISMVGQINLLEMAALIKMTPLLITNNTGPAHMAAAFGTPLVELYALTNPQHMPWKSHSKVLYHDVPCKNCFKSICPMGHHDCLRLVAPLTVIYAAIELLQLSI